VNGVQRLCKDINSLSSPNIPKNERTYIANNHSVVHPDYCIVTPEVVPRYGGLAVLSGGTVGVVLGLGDAEVGDDKVSVVCKEEIFSRVISGWKTPIL